MGDGGGHAHGAGGVVDPGEEGAFEPSALLLVDALAFMKGDVVP